MDPDTHSLEYTARDSDEGFEKLFTVNESLQRNLEEDLEGGFGLNGMTSPYVHRLAHGLTPGALDKRPMHYLHAKLLNIALKEKVQKLSDTA